MKRNILIVIICVLSTLAKAQETKIPFPAKGRSHLEMEKMRSEASTSKNRTVIVTHSTPLNPSELSKMGAQLSRSYNGFSTVVVPKDKINLLKQVKGVKHVDAGAPAQFKMDKIISSIRADSVYLGINLPAGYTGENALVAIIDIGFVFTHPFYRNMDGSLKIKKVWIQQDESGAAPSGFNYGTEYADSTAILEKSSDYGEFGGHGHAMSMVAYGSGYGMPDQKYHGVATGSDVILVSTWLESEAQAIDAVQYCVDYARSVGKPLVINCSFGFLNGPNDGSALLDQFIDSLYFTEGPAIVVSGAVGNDGMKKSHLLKTNASPDSIVSSLSPTENFTYNDYQGFPATGMLWGEVGNTFSAAVGLMNAQGEIVASTPLRSTAAEGITEDEAAWQGNEIMVQTTATPAYYTNNKPNLMMVITLNIANSTSFPVLILYSTSGNVHVQFNAFEFNANNPHTTQNLPNLTTGDDNYADIGTPSTSLYTLGVGGYVNKIKALNIFGDSVVVFTGYSGNATWTEGDHIFYSVKGPTLDDRTKPELVAPVDGIYAIAEAVQFNDLEMLADSMVYQGTSYYFSIAWGGTSSAAPVVSGVAALVLDANPNLTSLQVRDILLESAIVDNFVTSHGAVPNNTMGYGKVNAYKAVQLALLSVSDNTINSSINNAARVSVYPNPAEDILNYMLDTPSIYTNVSVYDQFGRMIYRKPLTSQYGQLPMNDLSSGMYFMLFENGTSTESVKVLKR